MKKINTWVGRAVIIRWSIVAVIVFGAMIWGYKIIVESEKRSPALQVYGERDEDGAEHTIRDFSLTDQDGNLVSQEKFKGKIYVADFFFTTCEGICPLMSDQLERVAEKYNDNPDVLLLSHTVKPEEDSVPVLKEYATAHKADSTKWFFVTAPRIEINRLAHNAYMLGGDTGNDSSDFVHTQFFALVDRQRRIRGFYDGTDSSEVNKLMGDIDILLREE